MRVGDAAIVARHVEAAVDSASRRRGLLGRDSLPADAALIIAPCSAVHTFFMRFPIDVVFVRRDGAVVKVRHTLGPSRMTAAPGAFATIELAAGAAARVGLEPGDLLTLVGAEMPAAGHGSNREDR